jgi:hypothetical protein
VLRLVSLVGRIVSGEALIMVKFLLFCILLVFCWPLALLALILYPFVWLILLPFRIVGFAVDGVFELIRGLFMLPGRILRAV